MKIRDEPEHDLRVPVRRLLDGLVEQAQLVDVLGGGELGALV
jgi:hypothetical protein